MHRMTTMHARPRSQMDRQTDRRADEHLGNSATTIRSNERIAR